MKKWIWVTVLEIILGGLIFSESSLFLKGIYVLIGIWTFILHFRSKQQMFWVLILLISIGLRSYQVYHPTVVPEGELTGIIRLNRDDLKINGDFVTGIAELELTSSNHQVLFQYKMHSEKERALFEEEEANLTLSVIGKSKPVNEPKNRGDFNAPSYYRSIGILRVFEVKGFKQMANKPSWISLFQNWRRKFYLKIDKQPESFVRTYALLLLFGKTKDADETVIGHYKRLGIMHVLAISGLHITLFIRLLEKVLWKWNMTRETSVAVIIVGLVIYGYFIHWNISGTRAILMYVLAQMSKKFHWKLTTEDCLGIIFLLSLFYRTSIIENVAFQLSYGLTAILLLTSYFAEHNIQEKWKKTIWIAFLTPMIALPLICHYFFTWNLLSVLLAGLVVLLFESILIPGILLYALAVVIEWVWISNGIVFFLDALLKGLNHIFTFCEQFLFLRFTFGTWSTMAWILYWITLYGALVCYEKSWFRPYSSVVLAIGSCLIALSIPYHLHEQIIFLSTGTQVSVLYIPKGFNHATLIVRGENSFADSKEKVLSKQPFSKNVTNNILVEGISQLDSIVLTNASVEDGEDLKELIQDFSVGEVVISKNLSEKRKLGELDVETHFHEVGDRQLLSGVKWELIPANGGKKETQNSIFTLDEKQILIVDEKLNTLPHKADIVIATKKNVELIEKLNGFKQMQTKSLILEKGNGKVQSHISSRFLDQLEQQVSHIWISQEDGAVHMMQEKGVRKFHTIKSHKDE
ncbi:ComEC/Rec2 family competence protein [uncultured Granulicatella sp.]|uniref:ComEC/Rec2 family competence protein n=1 Tax=uncultured Granulicatella sp. TaxID=316089 RepID=UPI0028D805C4|nr:ComEC/Rec2 family competence protein [uncultured Granulicatella sp.]